MKSISVALFAVVVGCAFVQPLAAAEGTKFREKVLHSFGNGTDGRDPFFAGVIDVKGTLYGATYQGGGTGCSSYADGCGTVFSVDPATGAETLLHSFLADSDGASPEAGLINVKGTLYGTTSRGGSTGCGDDGCGTVFSLDRNTDAEKVLYAFCRKQNCRDGSGPEGALISMGQKLYGTTAGGGAGSNGTVFSIDRNTGIEKVIYSFCQQQNCADGAYPTALINVNGVLYGTTYIGGAYPCANGPGGCGTIFSLDPHTGIETVLHSFGNGTDGQMPEGGLIALDGILYGTTNWGGSGYTNCNSRCGTVFSFDPGTGTENVLYSFCSQSGCSDGAVPYAGLIDVNGALYGTTDQGGGIGGCGGLSCGTVFSVDPNSGAETVLYTFCSEQNCADGASPEAGLIVVKGNFYGTTSAGGAYSSGTVFVLKTKR